jgi:hypothetical protein
LTFISHPPQSKRQALVSHARNFSRFTVQWMRKIEPPPNMHKRKNRNGRRSA